MFDVTFPPETHAALRALVTRAFLAGAEREAQLESALETPSAIRTRLELILRAHNIPVPTDPLPSEPPERE